MRNPKHALYLARTASDIIREVLDDGRFVIVFVENDCAPLVMSNVDSDKTMTLLERGIDFMQSDTTAVSNVPIPVFKPE